MGLAEHYRKVGKKYCGKIILLLIWFSIIGSLIPQEACAMKVKWNSLQSKHFIVYYENKEEGRRALSRANNLYSRLKSDFDYWPTSRISIYIYHSHSNFLSNSPAGISRAYSQPFMNRIVVSATKGSMDAAIAHELCHVVFLQSVPDATTIPFWFSEGIAIYWSQLQTRSSESEFYPVQGEVYSISRLSQERPEATREQEKIAAQGNLAIQYLVDKYGKNRFKLLVKNLQEGTVFPIALEKSMGTSETELDKAWLVYATARSREVYMESLQYFGLLVIGLLAFMSAGVWFKKRKERAEELKEESEEEQTEAADY